MAAFNWIEFAGPCPTCRVERTIHAQTHVASDYAGNDTGRFHDAVYHLGQSMKWWCRSDPSYANWKNGNRKEIANAEVDEEYECCYAQCLECNAKLYAIVRFVNCIPIQVKEIGHEENWPGAYLKQPIPGQSKRESRGDVPIRPRFRNPVEIRWRIR